MFPSSEHGSAHYRTSKVTGQRIEVLGQLALYDVHNSRTRQREVRKQLTKQDIQTYRTTNTKGPRMLQDNEYSRTSAITGQQAVLVTGQQQLQDKTRYWTTKVAGHKASQACEITIQQLLHDIEHYRTNNFTGRQKLQDIESYRAT